MPSPIQAPPLESGLCVVILSACASGKAGPPDIDPGNEHTTLRLCLFFDVGLRFLYFSTAVPAQPVLGFDPPAHVFGAAVLMIPEHAPDEVLVAVLEVK